MAAWTLLACDTCVHRSRASTESHSAGHGLGHALHSQGLLSVIETRCRYAPSTSDAAGSAPTEPAWEHGRDTSRSRPYGGRSTSPGSAYCPSAPSADYVLLPAAQSWESSSQDGSDASFAALRPITRCDSARSAASTMSASSVVPTAMV